MEILLRSEYIVMVAFVSLISAFEFFYRVMFVNEVFMIFTSFFASKKFRSYDQTCFLILFAWRSQIYSTHFLKFKELCKHIVKFNCFVATMCKPYNKHSLNADFRNCIALLQQKNGLLFKYINVVSSVFGIVKIWHPPLSVTPQKGWALGKLNLKLF